MTRARVIKELAERLGASDSTDLVNRLEGMVSDLCITIDDVPDSDLCAALAKVRRRSKK